MPFLLFRVAAVGAAAAAADNAVTDVDDEEEEEEEEGCETTSFNKSCGFIIYSDASC